jgi:hypothetical protein
MFGIRTGEWVRVFSTNDTSLTIHPTRLARDSRIAVLIDFPRDVKTVQRFRADSYKTKIVKGFRLLRLFPMTPWPIVISFFLIQKFD